ncbi:MAG: HAD-IB family hydrolase [Clostridiaceae bacterium]
MDKLAVFDVDYTLTSMETQVTFLKFMIKKNPSTLMHLPKSAFAGVSYLLKLKDEKESKEMHWSMISGMTIKELNDVGSIFFDEEIKKLLYIDAIKEIKKRRGEGYRIILSSASPEFYIRQFEKAKMIEKAMGTRFQFEDGIFKGKVNGLNNKGEEKVRRLLEYLDGTDIDWENSVMYSDSLSDRPLMELCGKGYLINHKPHPDFEVLHWK